MKIVIGVVFLLIVIAIGLYEIRPGQHGGVVGDANLPLPRTSSRGSEPTTHATAAPATMPTADPVPGSVFRLTATGDSADLAAHNAEATTDRFGHPGRAYSFNGQDSFLQINKPLGLTPDAMTISIWARYNPGQFSNSWDRAIITQDGGDDDGGTRRYFQISTIGQKITCHRFGTGKDLFAKDVLQTDHWYSVVLTYEGTNFNLYVDGELNDSQPGKLRASDNEAVFIGKKGTGAANFFFDGQIGDVRIYKRALSAEEVGLIYHENGWPDRGR